VQSTAVTAIITNITIVGSSRFFESCNLMYIHVIQNQQNRHFFSLIIYFNYCVFNMFHTTKCSSLGRLVHAVLNSCKRSPYNRPRRAQRGSKGIIVALLILNLSARRGWVVSTTPRPLYLRERPGTHCTGGWVGPRAGLDVCEKISSP
jgi:hypothetical protein